MTDDPNIIPLQRLKNGQVQVTKASNGTILEAHLNIGNAQDQSILHYLARIGVCDDGHIAGGMTYLDWQDAYRALSGAKTMRFDTREGSGRMDDKASGYLRLVRELGLNYQADLELAVRIAPVKKEMHTVIFQHRYRFIKALNRAGAIISQIQTSCAIMPTALQ